MYQAAQRENGAAPSAKRPRGAAGNGSWLDALLHPRTLVFLVLALGVLFGGGYKLLAGWRSRRAANRLTEPDATPDEIRAAWQHGRRVLPELMDLLQPERDEVTRAAAGAALSRLWAADDLVAEEEQAIVRVGHRIVWNTRRIYPRALRRTIPIHVRLDVHAIGNAGGITVENLQVAWKLAGARRLSFERYSDWMNAGESFVFEVDPSDLQGRGPHSLSVGARVRTHGLTSRWEMELPARQLALEFDDRLEPDAILTLADADRGKAIERAVRLQMRLTGDAPHGIKVGTDLMLETPLELVYDGALPCDLAHRLELEIEGHTARISCDGLVWLAEGPSTPHHVAASSGDAGITVVERPGDVRVRAVLDADPQRGWVHPGVRSVWPERVVSDWLSVAVVRS